MADSGGTADWHPYAHRRVVVWSDADPARIAYTGRFADFALEAIEGWYRDRLGTDWYRLTLEEGVGTPFVHLGLDFKHPARPGDTLDVSVIIDKVGRTSLTFGIRAVNAASGTLCFTGAATSVFVDAASMRPVPVPSRYRQAIEREHRGAVASRATR